MNSSSQPCCLQRGLQLYHLGVLMICVGPLITSPWSTSPALIPSECLMGQLSAGHLPYQLSTHIRCLQGLGSLLARVETIPMSTNCCVYSTVLSGALGKKQRAS